MGLHFWFNESIGSELFNVIQSFSDCIVRDDGNGVEPVVDCGEELLSLIGFNHVSEDAVGVGQVNSQQLHGFAVV